MRQHFHYLKEFHQLMPYNLQLEVTDGHESLGRVLIALWSCRHGWLAACRIMLQRVFAGTFCFSRTVATLHRIGLCGPAAFRDAKLQGPRTKLQQCNGVQAQLRWQ